MLQESLTPIALLDSIKPKQKNRPQRFSRARRVVAASPAVAAALCCLACWMALRADAQSAVATATESVPAMSAGTAPSLVRWSGSLPEAAGQMVQVRFALYEDQAGGLALWNETQTVKVGADGRYSVLLGATSAEGLPQALFQAGEARWIEATPVADSGGETAGARPRSLLAAVPYAFKAVDSETLAGREASDYVTREELQSAVAAAVPATAQPNPETNSTLTGSGTKGYVPLWTGDTLLGDSVIAESGSRVGIGTATPAAKLDVNGASTLRGTVSLPATVATAKAGVNSPSLELGASVFSSTASAAVAKNFAWRAVSAGNNTGSPTANLELLFGSGSAPPTSTGLSIAPNGQITFAAGQTFPGGGGGSITDIVAGTDLTGGGDTGKVTLKLDTTKVPQLGAANVFTATQTIDANLILPATTSANAGVVVLAGRPFLQACCIASPANTFVGMLAGNFAETGEDADFNGANTGVGYQAMAALTTGVDNTAVGSQALVANTSGGENTVVGQEAMQSNTQGSSNTAVGQRALRYNTTGGFSTAVGANALNANSSGSYNTAVGYGALNSNATGSENTATGFGALGGNSIASQNTADGYQALANNAGRLNTAVGWYALTTNTTGIANTAIGDTAMYYNTSGYDNVAAGDEALQYNTTGFFNIAIGPQALVGNTTGSQNIAVGPSADSDLKTGNNNIMLGSLTGNNLESGESNNIYIGNNVYGVSGESGVIRIGLDSSMASGCTTTSFDNGCEAKTIIAAIRGVTTANQDAVDVVIDSAGQLGTVSSSRRYKEDIHDMAGASDGLLRLRPVTFRYKKPYADGSKPVQYGLIAEEVAEVFPDLVARNKDGQVETVQYWKLSAMLLNEIQKLSVHRSEDERQIAQDEQRIGDLSRDREADRDEIAFLKSQIAEQRRQLEAQFAQLAAQVRGIQVAIRSKEAVGSQDIQKAQVAAAQSPLAREK